MFFFFQAEDGIRDLVRSRGLGDVYKRQVRRCKESVKVGRGLIPPGDDNRPPVPSRDDEAEPVSYTHLTLPTSDLV